MSAKQVISFAKLVISTMHKLQIISIMVWGRSYGTGLIFLACFNATSWSSLWLLTHSRGSMSGMCRNFKYSNGLSLVHHSSLSEKSVQKLRNKTPTLPTLNIFDKWKAKAVFTSISLPLRTGNMCDPLCGPPPGPSSRTLPEHTYGFLCPALVSVTGVVALFRESSCLSHSNRGKKWIM